MFIKKGTKLRVLSRRRGTYEAEAENDFDTELDEFYPVITREYVCSLTTEWFPGEHIPCRRGINRIIVLEDNDSTETGNGCLKQNDDGQVNADA